MRDQNESAQSPSAKASRWAPARQNPPQGGRGDGCAPQAQLGPGRDREKSKACAQVIAFSALLPP